VCNKLHTLLHCPHSSPLFHPAILSLTRSLRYDLCSWSSHTPLQQTTTKHGLTLPPPHAHNSSTHSNLTFANTNPQPLLGPYRLSPPPLPAHPLMIHSARCVKVPLTRKKCISVTYVTPVGIWTASSSRVWRARWRQGIAYLHLYTQKEMAAREIARTRARLCAQEGK